MLPNRKLSGEPADTSPPSGWAPFGGASDFGKNIGIAFVAILIILTLAFTAGALIRRLLLHRHRRRHHSAAAEKPNPSQLVAQPLEAIPAVLFSAREGLLAAECAICLLEFADGDAIRVLPNCSHGFHVGCIDLWISSRNSCPTCRKSYLPQP